MGWTRGRTVGRGSTATVSVAASESSGTFAVKSCKLSQSKLLQREQKILSSVTCPQIVSYKGCDISMENGQVFYNIFMEYVPGGTLVDAVRAHGGALDEPVIGIYTRQILLGLEYLHSIGIVHCDIKGRNILIGPSGAKIGDLGCARQAALMEDEAALMVGTPLFMAPEVARGEEQGYSADIWSLGCTIIEMATGKAPWESNYSGDPVSFLYWIAYSGELLPEFPGVLSEEAKNFLSNCLRRNPAERWTATQLLEHPFMKKFSSCSHQLAKEIHSNSNSNSKSNSNSPTSVLDQGIWSCVDVYQTEERSCLCSSPEQRIRELSSSSAMGTWRLEKNWITIRGGH
ncbi:hypothetical protein Nepgr_013883 [Nepenthes gracilis]|uniref:Protein kinase domain-containing protein n=1 Tax=Nepenthes gracilis TaxID=150966 RepID=A0AAD3XP15_NEPGR|nr:hypothetical protein Nepgr_013883 [Nepenthes gracilis]